MIAHYTSRNLIFKRPSGTSRGILSEKKSWFIVISEDNVHGIGECGPLKGLSLDDTPKYEEKLKEVIAFINGGEKHLRDHLDKWPSIKFGLEMAILDLENKGTRTFFPSAFSQGKEGIPINGLVWMGDVAYMKSQIKSLLERDFHCLKMKIGAINFEDEVKILRAIRKEFSKEDLMLRVDANGAFKPEKALEKLKILSELDLHSIEQPIRQGQIDKMKELCQRTPLPIALDEELIKVTSKEDRRNLLSEVKPQYIILKPSLLGGFQACDEWIEMAESQGIEWWITSALESNIGLNAISQYAYHKKAKGYQGLGTGRLFTNNIKSPLEIRGECIFYNTNNDWDLDGIC